jgi:hypothetical protein
VEGYNFQIVDTDVLESSVKLFMSQFDTEELKRKAKEKEGGGADDEGWVTVTKTYADD